MIKDKNLITYCGLYCADCHSFKERIPNLARDLRKELRSSRYDKFAEFISKEPFGKVLENYNECYEALGMMVKFRCKKGCKNGGGPPFCKIIKCCIKKGLKGCWECSYVNCKRLDFLKPVHGDAHIRNLKILKKEGTKEFIEGKRLWYSKIRK